MRPALATILPMLAAAVLVMVGGERLARRDSETRSPIDRDRLLDLDEALRGELTRLERLYLSHLDRLASLPLNQASSNKNLSAEAENVAGVKLIRVFRSGGKDFTHPIGLGAGRLLEIELEGRKKPLNPAKSVIIEASLLEHGVAKNGFWLDTPDGNLSLFCKQIGTAERAELMVFLIDRPLIQARTREHLASWIKTPMLPLRESGERIVIESANGKPLIITGPEHHGPAAAIIPLRNALGGWQIKGWDGLLVTRTRDPATMAVASTLALGLLASGILLCIQQNRALQLAAKRVSFVNRVSHELGAPLTNLALNLDLATETLDYNPVETRKRLSLVAEETERLARLVANVLTFSRTERDALQLKPVRCLPGELIARTLESFRPALMRRGIVIETDIATSREISLDPDALSQITGNLISNVEKYAASGHWLKLVYQQEQDHITLEVHDRGPGIPAADREQIFAPFTRVLSTTTEGSSGTGLGLTIARDLTLRMGGSLELIDSSDGTMFRLHLPTQPTLGIIPPTTT